ncbi:hypothetical protein V2J09_004084 [Rumex salicifolius]
MKKAHDSNLSINLPLTKAEHDKQKATGQHEGVNYPKESLFSTVFCGNGRTTITMQEDQTTTSITPVNLMPKPRGAELLPQGIIEPESDLYLRKLWGNPRDDYRDPPKYLVTFTVGYNQRNNIDAAVKKFSDNFTIVLFHYDGRVSEWDEFEWSKKAIHISAAKQTKWWYAKRFLHPDVVAPYDYVFMWDEDLGVEHFDAEEYIKMIKKHGLEISQPGLEPSPWVAYELTKRNRDPLAQVHKEAKEKPGKCTDPKLPPCAGFVEIMAPAFTRDAWRCIWYMIQNDLVHGWGIDFSLRKCVQDPNEQIGVVDSQWIVHQGLPSLGGQGEIYKGKTTRQLVRERCRTELRMFRERLEQAEKSELQTTNATTSVTV